MLMMKKDMGGAALMLALAQCVMALGLPVRLRLLIPAVENSIGGAAFRPGRRADDAQRQHRRDHQHRRRGAARPGRCAGRRRRRGRRGLHVGCGNPDRCGAGCRSGPELAALFTPDDALAREPVASRGSPTSSPLWRLPLHAPVSELHEELRSPILVNASSKPFAGATTAALFLQGVRQGRRRPGRIWTCSPGMTTTDPAGRAAARPRPCGRCWP